MNFMGLGVGTGKFCRDWVRWGCCSLPCHSLHQTRDWER